MNIAISMYIIIISISLICAGYNWMYKKEIHRMEKQVGVLISPSLIQLVSAIIYISLFIALVSFFLLLFSLITR